jgi:hypothetical protein
VSLNVQTLMKLSDFCVIGCANLNQIESFLCHWVCKQTLIKLSDFCVIGCTNLNQIESFLCHWAVQTNLDQIE